MEPCCWKFVVTCNRSRVLGKRSVICCVIPQCVIKIIASSIWKYGKFYWSVMLLVNRHSVFFSNCIKECGAYDQSSQRDRNICISGVIIDRPSFFLEKSSMTNYIMWLKSQRMLWKRKEKWRKTSWRNVSFLFIFT